ncbi:MAG: hypothetical protein DCF32_06315 [Leptolyngbya sp.]|nr:MAG: hypothetical protein DCF32_06315 [Leptolyngbya sp.]
MLHVYIEFIELKFVNDKIAIAYLEAIAVFLGLTEQRTDAIAPARLNLRTAPVVNRGTPAHKQGGARTWRAYPEVLWPYGSQLYRCLHG